MGEDIALPPDLVRFDPRGERDGAFKIEQTRIAEHRPASGVRKVRAEDVSSLPNPADDVFHMMRHLPGVSSNDVGSSFHVRGGSMDETLVRIDGLGAHGRQELVELGHFRRLAVVPDGGCQQVRERALGTRADAIQ